MGIATTTDEGMPRLPFLVVLLLSLLVAALSHAAADPTLILRAVMDKAGGCGSCVQVEALTVSDGRVALRGFSMQPELAGQPQVRIGVISGRPDWSGSWSRRAPVFSDLRVDGLSVEVLERHPPRPMAGGGICLYTDEAHLQSGRVDVAESDDQPRVRVEGLEATARGLRWCPARRSWTGRASATGEAIKVGELRATDISAERAVAVGNAFFFREGRFRVGEAEGTGSGEITRLEARAAMHLALHLDHQPLEALVSGATGGESPVSGQATAQLELHSGGDLPVGGAWWEGQVRVAAARLYLGDEVGGLSRLALDIAPWVQRDGDSLALGAIRGGMRMRRGTATIDCLTQVDPDGGETQLVAWGEIGADTLALWLARDRKDDLRGPALHLGGTPRQPKVKVNGLPDPLPTLACR